MLKYMTVKNLLQARLKREMVKGRRLPSEAVLCEGFGVSRIMLQKARGILERAGLIWREQGGGTFYLGHQSCMQRKTSDLLESMLDPKGLRTRLLRECIMGPPPLIPEKLRLAPKHGSSCSSAPRSSTGSRSKRTSLSAG